jgi:hypothetical protein
MDKSLKYIILALAAFDSIPDDSLATAREISISTLREIVFSVKWDYDAPRPALTHAIRVFGYSERLFC